MILAAFIIVLFAAFVRSAFGFGYTLIATPLLTFLIEVKSVVVINLILVTATHVVVLSRMRQHIDLSRAVFINLGTLLGVPLGAFLLSRLDPLLIKLAIAVLVILFSILLMLGYSYQFKRESLGSAIAGFIGGAFMSSTSLGGPPVVLFLLSQRLAKEKFIATIAVYFLFASLISIGAFVSLGMVTTNLLSKVALFLPALLLGSYLGIKVMPMVKAELFRRIILFILLASALVIIVTGVMDM